MLLDEICPNTLKEMIAADGNGSDNMTIIIIDFLKHNGGCNSSKTIAGKQNDTGNF